MEQRNDLATVNDLFAMKDRVAIVTGGAGLLGMQHADILAQAGATPILVDLAVSRPEEKARTLEARYGVPAMGLPCDITNRDAVHAAAESVMARFGRVDVLVNNAANNPKMESQDKTWSRLETFSTALWDDDLAVGLKGAFLCAQAFGTIMAKRRSGAIVNVASDLALIGPDQRIYREPGADPQTSPVKPVTYSVVKSGLIGLTRYLATYWASDNVRVNAISPGGVYNGQPDAFVARLAQLIPLGRMAKLGEYQGAILFLASDASSYMTGANLVVDGGRTTW